MLELEAVFSSHEDWNVWENLHGKSLASFRQKALSQISETGYEEPMSGVFRRPKDIVIRPNDLHESISCCELNSRKRALVLQSTSLVRPRS